MKKINLFESLKSKGVSLEEGEKKMLDELSNELNAAFEATQKGATLEEVGTEVKAKLDEAIKGLSVNAKSVILAGTGENGGTDKTLDEFLRDRSKEITDLQNATKGRPAGNPVEVAKASIQEAVTKVKARKAAGQSSEYFEEADKAAVVMSGSNTQANASGATVPANYMYGVEGQAAPDVRTQPFIQQFIDNGNTNLAAFPYADKLPNQGTMAITAEGALKPLLSVSIERRFSTAFKIAGRSKITEEALDDIDGILALVNGEQRFSFLIAEQNAIFSHVSAFAPAFVAGGMAVGTDSPNNYDAILAAIYAIKRDSKGLYMPNVVLMDSTDVYAMKVTKDLNGQYVLPPFILPDGSKIAGVVVIETQDATNVPAGTFIVGDFRKIHRRVYKPFTSRIGQMGIYDAGSGVYYSDFEANLYTVIGEGREHLYHYKNDETAFVKSTFAAVKTAIGVVVTP